MTPYAFDYQRAGSVEEALQLLADHDDAKLLAGGHSLIPAMKLRLAAPATLIDISGIDALTGIAEEGDVLHIGALCTHRAVEHSDLVRQKCRMLSEAAGNIGDPQVRNKGTIGGSLAHADPAADYPALVLALGATIHARGSRGSRSIDADDFFQGLFDTALADGEIITHVHVPTLGAGQGAAYAKFANPASKYAIVGVAARVTMDGGTCTEARLAVTGASTHAFRATNAEQALAGSTLDDASLDAALADMTEGVELMSDLSASSDYRAHLCRVMARRALRRAAEQAGG